MKIFKWAACAVAFAAFPAMAGDPSAMKGADKQTMTMPETSPRGFEDKASTAVKSLMEKRTEEYEKAWNAQDLEKMVSFYTADATVLNPDGTTATGKAEIRKQIERDLQGPLKNATVSLEIESVREVVPNVALIDLHQNVTGMEQVAGQSTMPTDFRVTVVAKKQGKEWLVNAIRVYADPEKMMGVGGSGPANQTGVEDQEPVELPAVPMPAEQPMR